MPVSKAKTGRMTIKKHIFLLIRRRRDGIIAIMIPSLIRKLGVLWPVLPPGVHSASLHEVNVSFATDTRRYELFVGLVDALGRLHRAGCLTAYLDGSYVTGARYPGDYDVCWDNNGVDHGNLDPLFLRYEREQDRAKQKAAFGGEFFPLTVAFKESGKSVLETFQQDKLTKQRKGIVAVSLSAESLLSRRRHS